MKITELLAIYAAFLSTIVFFWNLRRATSRVKVELIFGIEEIEGESVDGVYVFVKNPSAQTVHLARISPLYRSYNPSLLEKVKYAFKYRRCSSDIGWVHTSFSYFDIDDGCPLSLEPGKSHRVFIAEDKIEKMLGNSNKKELRAVVQDELWRDKYSKVFVASSFANAEDNK